MFSVRWGRAARVCGGLNKGAGCISVPFGYLIDFFDKLAGEQQFGFGAKKALLACE